MDYACIIQSIDCKLQLPTGRQVDTLVDYKGDIVFCWDGRSWVRFHGHVCYDSTHGQCQLNLDEVSSRDL